MLVLANGAFKSGSTWLFSILKATETFESLPAEFSMDTEGDRQWLKPERVKDFLESGVYRDADYLAKGHHFGRGVRELFLSYEGVVVFNIKRDLKDSLVAHFYHLIRQNKLSADVARPERRREGFSSYYWRLGRFKAQQIMTYHQVWDAPSPRVYVSSFERLKTDFEDEVRRIGRPIGFDFSPGEIAELARKTNIQTLQQARGFDKVPEHKRFFRKGLVGEWREHFGPAELADIEKVQAEGLGAVDMFRYRALFAALDLRRRWLGKKARSRWGE